MVARLLSSPSRISYPFFLPESSEQPRLMKHSPFFQRPTSHLPISIPLPLPTRKHSSIPRSPPLLSSRLRAKFFQIQRNSTRFEIPSQLLLKSTTSWLVLAAAHLPFAKLVLSPLPCFAAETGNLSEKINIEAIVVSINDFFNRYPFFVSSLAFIWLFVIPLTQDYLSKCKFIASYDAFQKLRDDPRVQLLDIRKKKSVAYLNTPNLKLYNKDAVHVEFVEGDEEGFVKDVLKAFGDPGNTALCVLDNFDGNSMRAAELLFKNGFKESYAIKGGLQGKDGWQAIQETLLPPSLHVYPRKRRRSPGQANDSIEGNEEQNGTKMQLSSSSTIDQKPFQTSNDGNINSNVSIPEAKHVKERPLSPYPNYTDLKPPSSPTPSKPQP